MLAFLRNFVGLNKMFWTLFRFDHKWTNEFYYLCTDTEKDTWKALITWKPALHGGFLREQTDLVHNEARSLQWQVLTAHQPDFEEESSSAESSTLI